MASKASPAATIRQGCAGLWVRPACLSVVAVMRNKKRSKVPEPSMICVFIADGWLCLYRTVHDIGLWRGRFASEIWTVRDIESQRGRFGPGEWNQPRNGALTWKVPTLIPELSVIQDLSVEGSRLDA